MHWRRKWQPTPVFLPGESQRKRVKFTTFTTLPSEELAYDSVPAGEEDEEDEEDLGWGCPDVTGTTRSAPPPDLHNYMRRIKEIA